MKKKTAVLTAGFLSLGVLVLASNMTVDGREGAKGKTIPYTLEITLPENASSRHHRKAEKVRTVKIKSMKMPPAIW